MFFFLKTLFEAAKVFLKLLSKGAWDRKLCIGRFFILNSEILNGFCDNRDKLRKTKIFTVNYNTLNQSCFNINNFFKGG